MTINDLSCPAAGRSSEREGLVAAPHIRSDEATRALGPPWTLLVIPTPRLSGGLDDVDLSVRIIAALPAKPEPAA